MTRPPRRVDRPRPAGTTIGGDPLWIGALSGARRPKRTKHSRQGAATSGGRSTTPRFRLMAGQVLPTRRDAGNENIRPTG
jgi:hypothetical protein